MRKIKEVLRLKYESGCSHGEIARSCSIAHSTVLEYLRRAEAAGLCAPLRRGKAENYHLWGRPRGPLDTH